jgi:hypothetical protein
MRGLRQPPNAAIWDDAHQPDIVVPDMKSLADNWSEGSWCAVRSGFHPLAVV